MSSPVRHSLQGASDSLIIPRGIHCREGWWHTRHGGCQCASCVRGISNGMMPSKKQPCAYLIAPGIYLETGDGNVVIVFPLWEKAVAATGCGNFPTLIHSRTVCGVTAFA